MERNEQFIIIDGGAEKIVVKTKPTVVVGSKWVHTNGNKYEVILLTNGSSVNEKYPSTVVYKGENGKIWSRYLSDWGRSFTKI